MDYPRPCGCKGCRTCLLCEKEFGINKKEFEKLYKESPALSFCIDCNKLYSGWDAFEICNQHPHHNGEVGTEYTGVFIQKEFINNKEEECLMTDIDSTPWDISQSGRRKQNYGPKTNFKKMKLQMGTFNGFPEYSRFLQERLQKVSLLKDFQTIEQCSLEYNPARGASIDPHIDDCWIWGERVVTVNCLSDTILTLARYKGDNKRYNLNLVDSYKNSLICNLDKNSDEFVNDFRIIRIPMPRRSLIVLYGPPRYQWEHCVLRDDIKQRRVCIAYREFTPFYLPNGDKFLSSENILKRAQNFWTDYKYARHNGV